MRREGAAKFAERRIPSMTAGVPAPRAVAHVRERRYLVERSRAPRSRRSDLGGDVVPRRRRPGGEADRPMGARDRRARAGGGRLGGGGGRRLRRPRAVRGLPTDAVVELRDGRGSQPVPGAVPGRKPRGTGSSARTGRRRGLAGRVECALSNLFAGRVLYFDGSAARAYAEIVATRQAIGRPLSLADGQIAPIARSRAMVIVTRNVRDFEGSRVDLVSPWATDE